MDNFRLHLYTDIVFGKGAECAAGKKVVQHGGKKVMLVFGGGSIKRSGLFDIVANSLYGENLTFIEFGGVQPNPLLSYARKGIEIAKKECVDFLLGVGGGSAIDTAKAIAVGLANEGDLWDFYSNKPVAKMAPVGSIHTIPATGTEMSRSSVLVSDERVKQGIMSEALRPVFALMNPEWTYSLPAYQKAASASDIFAHALERYFFPSQSYIGDALGQGVMRTVVKYAPIAIAQPQDYQSHAELMLAGSFAHNDITGIGNLDLGLEGSCHGLEAQISGMFDTTHGAGLAVMMPYWIEYTATRTDMTRHVKFATEVFDVEADMSDPMGVVLEGIRRFKTWLKSIGMPLTLTELGLKASDIPVLTQKSAAGKPRGKMYPIKPEDYENIFRMSL